MVYFIKWTRTFRKNKPWNFSEKNWTFKRTLCQYLSQNDVLASSVSDLLFAKISTMLDERSP